MRIKRLTYKNLVYVIRRLQAKGYDFAEAEDLARKLFANFNPNGLSMDDMIDEVMTKEEYKKEYAC